MKFEPTICSDCSYPPNFVITEIPSKGKSQCYTIKCRDCGDSWEESSEHAEDNIDIDDD